MTHTSHRACRNYISHNAFREVLTADSPVQLYGESDLSGECCVRWSAGGKTQAVRTGITAQLSAKHPLF